MVLENPDVSTEQLRINVCSPGGTTIEAVNVLVDTGFMEIVKTAAQAANDKSKEMTK
jgi:pyrroline-5-carboxylate reductase